MNTNNKINFDSVVQTLEIINGKWKIPIIVALRLHGKSRFKDLMEKVEGIGTKMLSKELKRVEDDGIIQRQERETTQVIIEYELTLYGETVDQIINELSNWAKLHVNKS